MELRPVPVAHAVQLEADPRQVEQAYEHATQFADPLSKNPALHAQTGVVEVRLVPVQLRQFVALVTQVEHS